MKEPHRARVATLLLALQTTIAAGCDPASREAATQTDEERWRLVERWAVPPAECEAEAASLLAAQAAAPDTASVAPRDDGSAPEIPVDALEPTKRLALEALHVYREVDGGYAGARPDAGPRPIPLLSVGRLGLATARGDEDISRVEDVMFLSSRLRRCGTFVDGMVGLILASETATWARDRGATPTPTLATLAPTREEVLDLLARDAVETHRFMEEALGDGLEPGSFVERARWLASGVSDGDRELARLRSVLADRVHAARSEPRDLRLAARAAAQTRIDEDAGPLVRIIVLDVGPHMEEAEQSIAAYEAFLSSTGPPRS